MTRNQAQAAWLEHSGQKGPGLPWHIREVQNSFRAKPGKDQARSKSRCLVDPGGRPNLRKTGLDASVAQMDKHLPSADPRVLGWGPHVGLPAHLGVCVSLSLRPPASCSLAPALSLKY